jgi:hypothetical protein
MGAFGELNDWMLNTDICRFEDAMNEVTKKCTLFAA